MIKPMDFCRVVSSKKLKGSGLSMGDIVMVAGTSQVPATHKDPYLMRTLMTVLVVEGGLPIIPSEENGKVALMVDPRSLEKVSDSVQQEYENAVKAQYG